MSTKTVDFSRYSSFKIGPVAEVTLIDSKAFDPSGFFVIGGANNLLIGMSPPPLAMLDKPFDFCELEADCIRAGGAFNTGRLASFCRKHDLKGLEFAGGLPGTVGGLVAMNAGMKQWETFDRLLWVDFGRGRVLAGEIEHGYRWAKLPGVVFEAGFKRESGFDTALEAEFKKMRLNQPHDPSAGSCFKNPPGDYAGRLIEAVGLKGFIKGGMAFSPKHANFLINTGGGACDDAFWLIDEAKTRVLAQFGIALECEIKIL